MLKKFSIIWIFALALASCASPATIPAQPSILEQASKDATAIIEQAQATALVIQAQSQATAMVAQADAPQQVATPAPVLAATVESAAPTATIVRPNPTATSSEQKVEIVRVTMALDGAMIDIQFRAPPEVAEKWWQGSIKVIDEKTGMEYIEIPVMPRLGPLISKPKIYGQVGNAMLVNNPPGVKIGDLVTVVLGQYTFEHIEVQ